MRGDTHQLQVVFKTGDLYIWDNSRLLHGQELLVLRGAEDVTDRLSRRRLCRIGVGYYLLGL